MAKSNVVAMHNARSAEAFAGMVKTAWQEQLSSIFETGNLLEAAKNELAHGEWSRMFKECNMPFTMKTAAKLMAISDNENLRNDAHARLLPVAWTTLYELTKLKDEQFADGIKSGAIRPAMQRKDAWILRGAGSKPKKKDDQLPRTKTIDEWSGDLIVGLTEATSSLDTEERSVLFTRMRNAIESLEKRCSNA